MKSGNRLVKRIMAVLLAVAIFVVTLPTVGLMAAGSPAQYFDRVVDANTMNNWTKYFDLNNITTQNAGGVWTDKSVFTNADAFDGKVEMLDDSRNFLTALSALAANKEVVGYSTVPTDTVLVLDLSGSMENSNSEDDLIDAANAAIAELLKVNENNRVGVVLYSASGSAGTSTYSESVTRILPIDRYTTGSDNQDLRLSNNGRVSVDGDVEGTVAGVILHRIGQTLQHSQTILDIAVVLIVRTGDQHNFLQVGDLVGGGIGVDSSAAHVVFLGTHELGIVLHQIQALAGQGQEPRQRGNVLLLRIVGVQYGSQVG